MRFDTRNTEKYLVILMRIWLKRKRINEKISQNIRLNNFNYGDWAEMFLINETY